MAISNGSTPFVVSVPKPLLDKIREWVELAKRIGRAEEFLAVLREINDRLENDPHGWGDRLRNYATIEAVEMRGMIPKWLLVWYGIHDRARQVVVRSLLPATGSPLLSLQ